MTKDKQHLLELIEKLGEAADHLDEIRQHEVTPAIREAQDAIQSLMVEKGRRDAFLEALQRNEVQMLHAAISLGSKKGIENAANAIRDKLARTLLGDS